MERAYYLRFMRFVAAEHMLSKVGSRTKEDSGFATVWNSSVADKRVFIPMQGRAESLNVAMAAGIVMFEALRQKLK